MSETLAANCRRHLFLKREPALTRAAFSRHYEEVHGPLAVSLAGFRKYTLRYLQNHVEEGADPGFDGVTMTTQVPREDYSKSFRNEPDFDQIRDDEFYLFDMDRTVSVLSREELAKDGPQTPDKALILCSGPAFAAMALPSPTKIVLNHFDRSTLNVLGKGSADFPYDLLAEVWFGSAGERATASSAALAQAGEAPVLFVPVREVTMLDRTKP